MKITLKTKNYVVIDDLLPRDQFENLWLHVQNESYINPHSTQTGWQKVWRLNDYNCLGGPSYVLSKKPFNNYMDGASSWMLAAAKHAEDISGKQGENWVDATFRSYVYPRGSKLSWHNDAGNYYAALTYYTHPYWGSTWGGELLVANVSKNIPTTVKTAPHLDHKWEDEYLAEIGAGQWIFPKPNRLVIMAGGAYHSINRIDDNAGDNCRCSIVGFFLKESKCTMESNSCK